MDSICLAYSAYSQCQKDLIKRNACLIVTEINDSFFPLSDSRVSLQTSFIKSNATNNIIIAEDSLGCKARTHQNNTRTVV